MTELYLIWHFALSLQLEWRFLADPLTTLELLVDIGSPALSRRERAAIAEAVAEAIDGDGDDSPPNPAALMAAGRWFCQLSLPHGESELLAPVGSRGSL